MKFNSTSKILILIFTLQGCGVNITEKQDCIPKVSYVSTKSVKMFFVEVIDKEFSYSGLKINKNERFFCISVPNMLDCDDSYGKLKITNLPEGTFLELTGKVKRIEPYGFSTAFKSEITYLEGIVNNTIVWLLLPRLNLFTEYEHESSLNAASNKSLGINDKETTWEMKLDCFN